MSVCMYACMYVGTCICIYLYVPTYLLACLPAYLPTGIHAYPSSRSELE